MGEKDKEIDEDEEEEESDEETEGLGLKEKDLTSLKPLGSDDDDGDEINPLLTDLVGDSRQERRARKAENWFSQVRFFFFPKSLHFTN